MANTFGINTPQPRRRISINDIVPNHSIFIPVPGRSAIAVVERVSRPVDGELFYIRFRGQKRDDGYQAVRSSDLAKQREARASY